MFKSKQYRAKAAEYGALVKSSTSLNERREFQQLEQRFASLAENEQGLADDHDGSVHIADQDRSHDAALADERACPALPRGRGHYAMGHLTDLTATGDLRHGRVRGQANGDGRTPRTDRPVPAQTQE